jgi:hypothetical protein
MRAAAMPTGVFMAHLASRFIDGISSKNDGK